MPPPTLNFAVETNHGSESLMFEPERLVCCGWVGRDRAAVQAHIDELGSLGVPAPKQIPAYMNLSPYLLTTDGTIDVVSETTSGEVEYVLLCRGESMWVTVGSDQTDRDVETKSIPGSKQMCAKYVATRCWPYADVANHWDRLELRCWVTKDAHRVLYQEDTLGSILNPSTLLAGLQERPGAAGPAFVLFSGTVATKGGLVYADTYELELRDPVLGRSIRAAYLVRVLAQHV
jgi:hypothetical protein